MKNYERTKRISIDDQNAYMMGPNPLCLLEEVCEALSLTPGMRVLDLGCGKGLTSLMLAREFGVTVYAVDLWIPASENYERIKGWGMEDRIIPIHAEAHELPFAEGYFDALISIDSYHYYGANETYLPQIVRFLKPGAPIGLAFPGLTRPAPVEPPAMKAACSMTQEEWDTFQTLDWWKTLFTGSDLVELTAAWEIEDAREIWQQWADVAKPLGFPDDAFLKADPKPHLATLLAMALKVRENVQEKR